MLLESIRSQLPIVLSLAAGLVLFVLARRIKKDLIKQILDSLVLVALNVALVFLLISRIDPLYIIAFLVIEVGLLMRMKLFLPKGSLAAEKWGGALVLVGLALLISVMAHFPLWLWAVPVILYAVVLVIPALNEKMLWLSHLGLMVAVVFAGFCLYQIFSQVTLDGLMRAPQTLFLRDTDKISSFRTLHKEPKTAPWTDAFSQVKEPGLERPPAPEPQVVRPQAMPAQVKPRGPLTEAIRQMDEQMLELHEEKQHLEKKVENLRLELEQLKVRLKTKEKRQQQIIDSLEQAIDEIKGGKGKRMEEDVSDEIGSI